jgi:hypothetical protein
MTRARWRTVLLLAGLVPALAAVGFALLVLRVLVLQHLGDRAYEDGRYLDAAGHYRSAGHLDPFEDWLAAFDAGAARHTAGQLRPAIRAYRAALDFGVPHREECTVRINLSLAFEAVGDRAAQRGRLGAADDAYRSGISALEDGRCPSDAGRGERQAKDARGVDERLHRKLQHDRQRREERRNQRSQRGGGKARQHQTPQQRRQQQQEQQRAQQRERQREQERRRRLGQLNQLGQQQRQNQQNRDEGFGYQPSW